MFCWPAPLYNPVNKANVVHSFFLVYLFLIYLSISAYFGGLCTHHQEKQLCSCDTWYLLFCVVDCLVWRVEWNSNLHTRQHSCFSWWWAHSRPKYAETDKYAKNKYTKKKLCTKLALFITVIYLLNVRCSFPKCLLNKWGWSSVKHNSSISTVVFDGPSPPFI